MRKNLVWITVILLATMILAPAVMAQDQTVEEILADYLVVLNEAMASGDSSAWIEFYAEDATMSVPALAPQPVTGKDMIEAAMFPGIFGAAGGAVVTVVQQEIDGNTATVYYMYMGGAQGDFPIQEIFEFNDEGKIQSHTVNVGTTAPAAEAAEEAPTQLPETGGVGLNLLPGLLVLGGAALVGLGRRFSSR